MLVKCQECGKEISHEAKKCPNCGVTTKEAKDKKQKTKKNIIIAIVFILIFILLLGLIVYEKKSNDLYKYSRQAIKVLEDYLDNKITYKEASQKIDSIHDIVYAKSNEIKNTDDLSLKIKYNGLSIDLSSASLSLIKKDNSKINKIIIELKEY